MLDRRNKETENILEYKFLNLTEYQYVRRRYWIDFKTKRNEEKDYAFFLNS